MTELSPCVGCFGALVDEDTVFEGSDVALPLGLARLTLLLDKGKLVLKLATVGATDVFVDSWSGYFFKACFVGQASRNLLRAPFVNEKFGLNVFSQFHVFYYTHGLVLCILATNIGFVLSLCWVILFCSPQAIALSFTVDRAAVATEYSSNLSIRIPTAE